MRRLLLVIAAIFLGTGLDGVLTNLTRALANPPAPAVSVVSTSINEGLTATVQVQRAGNLSQPTVVIYVTADATALAGTNYTARSGSLTFAKNQSIATLTVPTIRDLRVRGNLYFIVRLGVAQNAVVRANGTVTVRDVDMPAPPVLCPDGTTVPAGQTCPVPPPPPPPGPTLWTAAPLHEGGLARAAMTEPWIGGSFRAPDVGEIFALYLNGWTFTASDRVAYSGYSLSRHDSIMVYAQDLEGVQPAPASPAPELPAGFWTGAPATAVTNCADAFDRPGRPGVVSGLSYRVTGTFTGGSVPPWNNPDATLTALPASNPYGAAPAYVRVRCMAAAL